MADEPYLVHIVDDDAAIRQSVGFMLTKAGYRTKSHASGSEFIKFVNSETTGCILLDVRMPGVDGLEVQYELAQSGIELPIIVLTGHGDVNLAVHAMKAGAVEFLEKPFERIALLAAIEAAFEITTRSHKAQLAEGDAIIRLAVLTEREYEVLGGMVSGRPNKLIAFDLGIATRTVEVHRASLMEKLHVRNLSGVLRIAFAAGLGVEA